MKLSQSSLAIIGILCAVIWLGCGTDDDNSVDNVTIEDPLRPSTKIAFMSNREGNREIYVMNADGTNVTIEDPLRPSTKIAFMSNREGNREIYVMNADGTDVVNLTNHDAYDDSPAWSPDGKKIAFWVRPWGSR